MNFMNKRSLLVPGSFPLRADSHCDTVIAEKNGCRSHIDFECMEQYCDLQFFALYLEEEGDTALAVEENEAAYECYSSLLKKYETKLIPVLTGADLKNIGNGRVGSLLAIENSEPLAEDSEALFRLYKKGYRSFGITWSNENSLGGGVNTDVGLKPLGRKVLRAMNALPVIVDLAHMNEQTFFDAMEILERPPIVTHACCRKLYDHKRNLTDEQLRYLAEARGMLGITFARGFLDINGGSIDRIVDHVIHAANIMGIDHVCFGSDFDGTDLPLDMTGQQDLEQLRRQMLERNFSSQEADAVLGENLVSYVWERLEGSDAL